MHVSDKKLYMDGYLCQNLCKIPYHLKDGYDCVIIISGSGEVRVGKSTLAAQVGYFIAWLLAGGKIEWKDEQNVEGKMVDVGHEFAKPNKPVEFDFSHIVFTPEGLMEIAAKLPRNSVIIYDEGRAGLESGRAMERINKAMADFLQTCGQYGHVLLIVLPSFFKLHEDYAVARSLCLLDVYTIQRGNRQKRGFFKFYNKPLKEILYYLGKKKCGTLNKYRAVEPNFRGRFLKEFPLDMAEYEKLKKESIIKKGSMTKYEKKWKKQRNACFRFLKIEKGLTLREIAKIINETTDEPLSDEDVRRGIEDWEREYAGK